MQQSKLKKILHNRDKQKNQQINKEKSKTDKQLHIIQLHLNDVSKQANRASAFSNIRKSVIKNELNKYLHPNSNHIRLKPYYESGTWIKWIGLLGDVTIPNQTRKGSLLIDKISVGNLPEIIDYHAWLNVENIKAIGVNRLPLAIGDYIVGYSKVKKYDNNKYGLAQTYIKGAGQFVEKRLESNYDRQDSWVVELENNELTLKTKNTVVDVKNSSNNKITAKVENVLENTSGHVDDRYQPTRYKKFQERLKKLNLSKSDDVLPLLSKHKHTYIAQVVQSHVVDLPNATHKMPQLEVKNVIDTFTGRLIFASYNLPYVPDLKVLGELKKDEIISFESQASSSNSNTFDMVTNFKLVNSDPNRKFVQLPNSINIFLGYIMWKHPEEGNESEYIASYQNWARSKSLHQEQIESEISSVRPTSPITEFDLAQKLKVKPELISDARRQGLIAPSIKGSLTVRYDPEAWDTMRKIIGAQDLAAIDFLRKKYPIYTINDLIKKSGLTRDEVEKKINAENYLSLNGLHCKINIYGPKVLEMLKTKKSIRELLPKKEETGTIKREIPRDKSDLMMTDNNSSNEVSKAKSNQVSKDLNSKQAESADVKNIDDNKLMQKNTENSNLKNDSDLSNEKEISGSSNTESNDKKDSITEKQGITFVHRAKRNYKELAKSITKNKDVLQDIKRDDIDTKPENKIDDSSKEKSDQLMKVKENEQDYGPATENEVILTLTDGCDYSYTFSNSYQEEITNLQKQAANPVSNILIKVLNLQRNEYEFISVKGILKIRKK